MDHKDKFEKPEDVLAALNRSFQRQAAQTKLYREKRDEELKEDDKPEEDS